MNKRIFWIDIMRGVAIIAVVICHQQRVLHNSEYIQCFTLYSVTSLIFLMGITKGMSLKKYMKSDEKTNILNYTFKSIYPTIMSYCLASIVYDKVINGDPDNMEIFVHILNFDACGPFYFIGHFIQLSFWAPPIYFILLKISKMNRGGALVRVCFCFDFCLVYRLHVNRKI